MEKFNKVSEYLCLLLSKYLDAFFPYLISFSNDIGLFDESPEEE
ncbi:MAG: hypothetical protein PHS92_04800 [Candidatus Gracilibacteria bacterium]|nr:hypothetical protein [Candidatus Gracilibacteria bacterium]